MLVCLLYVDVVSFVMAFTAVVRLVVIAPFFIWYNYARGKRIMVCFRCRSSSQQGLLFEVV